MPCCSLEQQFVMNHRRQLEAQSMHQVVPPLQKDDAGVDFSTAEGRKTSDKQQWTNTNTNILLVTFIFIIFYCRMWWQHV